ncbi:MAG: HAMP domain-containing protein [Planctomycetes bacterium]|nr:HAMP domain-containing protein [Planctomycetota bacterium]
MKRPLRSIRLKTRLWLAFTALLVSAVVPLSLLGVLRLSNRLQSYARSEALALASNIANLSAGSLLNFNYIDLKRIADEATRDNVRYVVVFDRKGNAVGASRGWNPSHDPNPTAAARADGADDGGASVVAVSYESPQSQPEQVLDVAVPVVLENSAARWGAVRVGYSLEPILAELRSMVMMAIVISAVVLVLGTIGIALLARHISRPLEELLQGAARIADGDYSLKLRVRRDDEIGELAREFSRMAVQVHRKQGELEHANKMLAIQVDEITREQSKLAAILRTVIDGLIVIDGEGRLLLANPAAESILRFEARAAIGHTVEKVISDDQLLTVLRKTAETADGVEADVNVALAGGDGKATRIMHTRTAVMRAETNRVRGVVAILQDVTKLRQAERAKSEFISNVSHELRTPISIMKVGIANLLRYKDIAEEQRRKVLEALGQENARLEGLISDLLDFARIESRSFTLRRSEFDLREIVHDVAESLRARADEARLAIELRVPQDPIPMNADRGKLRQVVTNLVVNAIHYTPTAGGKVSVSCDLTESVESIASPSHPRGRAAVIEVRDTGVGMSDEVLSRIFERFYRGHATQLTVPGTGLGLAIVKEIVEAHDGVVRVESRVNEGSVFRVILPMGTATDVTSPAVA